MNGDLSKGPVVKSMILFAIPMILGDLLQQCYNIADTLIVGRFLGEKALAAVISSITEALTNGDKVQLVGFGTFEIRDRKEKESKNPRTGEKIIVPAKKAPAFKAGKALKDAVNA